MAENVLSPVPASGLAPTVALFPVAAPAPAPAAAPASVAAKLLPQNDF